MYLNTIKKRAANGARTRDLDLGKVALYQLSYCRTYYSCKVKVNYSNCKEKSRFFLLHRLISYLHAHAWRVSDDVSEQTMAFAATEDVAGFERVDALAGATLHLGGIVGPLQLVLGGVVYRAVGAQGIPRHTAVEVGLAYEQGAHRTTGTQVNATEEITVLQFVGQLIGFLPSLSVHHIHLIGTSRALHAHADAHKLVVAGHRGDDHAGGVPLGIEQEPTGIFATDGIVSATCKQTKAQYKKENNLFHRQKTIRISTWGHSSPWHTQGRAALRKEE